MIGRLQNKTALITGAASDIGRASAERIAREGAGGVLADLNLEAAEELAEELQAGGNEAFAIRCDVSEGTRSRVAWHARWTVSDSSTSS